MKIPLRFQITEFDCGPTSLQNAISYLFEREEIPAEIIRTISIYTLDCYDENGKLGNGGTSREAINLMTRWIVDYANQNNFGIRCQRFISEEVNEEIIRDCINKKGCVLIRSYLEGEHYMLITDIDSKYVYLWDPYYLDESYFDNKKEIELIFNEPFKYNRKVNLICLNSESINNFALGPINKRECVLFYRVK